jgi:DNA-binding response OmpR family regulator
MRVLVVEDDASIAFVERQALEHDGFEVTICTRGRDAIAIVGSWAPDLIILDHGLPDIDGPDVIRSVRAMSDVAIIVVTARAEEETVVASLDLGADDYVVKPFRTPELLARVRAVLRRVAEPAGRGKTLEFKDLVLDQRARTMTKGGQAMVLTRIEFDILQILMRRAGEAVDREDMAREIWNLPAERIGKSLDVHMSVLRRKLGDDPRDPSYIATVRSVGFRMMAD